MHQDDGRLAGGARSLAARLLRVVIEELRIALQRSTAGKALGHAASVASPRWRTTYDPRDAGAQAPRSGAGAAGDPPEPRARAGPHPRWQGARRRTARGPCRDARPPP